MGELSTARAHAASASRVVVDDALESVEHDPKRLLDEILGGVLAS